MVATHPVQYHAPWFARLAEQVDLEVWYAHRQDASGQADAGFGVNFEWDVPLLDGYRYRWLSNVARRPGVGHFFGCDTPEIHSLLRRDSCDAVLAMGWNRKSLLQAAFAARRRGIPLLMRGDSQLRTRRSFLKRAVKYVPYRCLLPTVDAHLYVGQRNREYLRYYGVREQRLFFAPHFVDDRRFRAEAIKARNAGLRSELRKSLAISDDAFVVVFVGKFLPVKRAADFIDALRCLAARPAGPQVHGLLVGDGPLRDKLEKQAAPIRERIHFAGFRNQSELPGYYAASDLLVLPSSEETWGLVVNEAAACGIPSIVTTTTGCAPDMIEEGRTGFVYPVGDIAALAARVLAMRLRMAENPEGIHSALRQRLRSYSCEQACRGVVTALEFVS